MKELLWVEQRPRLAEAMGNRQALARAGGGGEVRRAALKMEVGPAAVSTLRRYVPDYAMADDHGEQAAAA